MIYIANQKRLERGIRMKVRFERKTSKEQLLPQDEFVIEIVVEISNRKFSKYLEKTLDDYDFIEENKDLMYVDSNNVWHCIFVTVKELDFGILIQSEGYSWARYSCYLSKDELKGGISNV